MDLLQGIEVLNTPLNASLPTMKRSAFLRDIMMLPGRTFLERAACLTPAS